MGKNKKILLWGIPAVIITLAALMFIFDGDVISGNGYVVRKGQLNAIIECVGEVNGAKARQIDIPKAIQDRDLRIYQIKIVDMVPEGKKVKKGDYIAQLDQTEISNRMRDRMQQKERADADLKNAKIDSTVTLTQKREDITNAKLDLEYNKIDLEQAKYESEAYQRKTKMAYEKAVIALDKRKRDYLLQQNRMKMHVMRLEHRVKYLDDLIANYQKAMSATRVTTPADGIVMLGKNWDGTKYKKDDEISTYRPLLATLPDMSTVISETYVKEIDVSKVNVGDSVSISIDALPDKKYTGKVTYVAPIGEEHKGVDMKVFRLVVQFDKSSGDLKPGMTCINHIIIGHYNDQPVIPESYVYAKDGKQVVYVKKEGELVAKPVQLGADAKKMVVVLKGLLEGDRIYHKQQQES